MQPLVERLMYFALLLLFITNGTLIVSLINTNHRLSLVVEQRSEDSRKNQEQLSKQITEMQRQHDLQDAEIRCIVKLFTSSRPETNDIDTCASDEPSRSYSVAPQSSSKLQQPPQQSSSPAPNISQPAQSQPNAIEQLLNKVGL